MIKFNLKKVMKQKNLNISQLNEMTGISRNSLSLLINGKSQGVQFETIEKITRALNIEVEELFEKSFNELKIETNHLYTKVQTSKYQEGEFDPITKEFIPTGIETDGERNAFSVIGSKYIIDGNELEGVIPYNFYLEFNEVISLNLNINFKSSEFKNDTSYLIDNLYNFSNLLVTYIAYSILDNMKETILKKITKSFNIKNKNINVTNDITDETINIPLNDTLTINFDYLNSEIKETNEKSQYEITFSDGIFLQFIQ
ncbi:MULTISPECIES: helix-turn-helix transcriptional regulator [unclassified Staphylococcus]|uniref:helix-turn-helix domain-containing protein n=1 Tax=unclassified Staphylococcus TaxID=91994 RepID=UPI001AEBB5E5|nr:MULTISPECIES: helix-turn-helix transcriptional regulator [unclassified Staphylococcus]